MDIRKIHAVGNGALAVTLPIGECRKMGLNPGTCMIAERIEDKIVLTPVASARQDKKATGAATIPQGECANG